MDITYGYCRVSTTHQNLTRQENNIKELFPNAIIIKEKFTGTTSARPQWEKLIKSLQSKDNVTIVFDSVSRMSRSALEGFQDYKLLYGLGVNLIFLNEPHINSSVFKSSSEKMIDMSIETGNEAIDEYFKGNVELINKLIFKLAEEQIRLAFEQSQKEVDDLHNRIQQGMREAKAQGKNIGNSKGIKLTTKKSKDCKKIIVKYSRDFNGILPDYAVIEKCKCTRNSYYKYKRELMLSSICEDWWTDELIKDILGKTTNI